MSRADGDVAPPRVIVAALGSEYRCDDGAGPATVRLLADQPTGVEVLGALADPLDLLGRWDDADLAVIVDVVRSGSRAGTVAKIELDADGAPGTSGRPPGVTTSHGFGLTTAVRLAHVLGNAPRRVVVLAITGTEFGPGVDLSPGVEEAIGHAARELNDLVHDAL